MPHPSDHPRLEPHPVARSSEIPSLNGAQQRRIGIILFNAFDTLDRAAALVCQEDDGTGRWTGLIPAEERAQLLAEIQELQERLHQTVQAFHLTRAPQNVRQLLQGMLNVLWVDLEDATPESLAGYGQLDAASGRFIAERMVPLARQAAQLLSTLEHRHN